MFPQKQILKYGITIASESGLAPIKVNGKYSTHCWQQDWILHDFFPTAHFKILIHRNTGRILSFQVSTLQVALDAQPALKHDTASTLAHYPHYHFMSLVFQGLQVYAKMGRAPRFLFSCLLCRTGKCKLLLPHGKKKKAHKNFGNDWKAQAIFHCKISTETPIRNKFLPSCLILLEYTLLFYDSHIPLWVSCSKTS